MTSSLLSLAAGFGLGLSLIVAIGAQNAYVLRQGLLGRHIGAVVTVCAGSDLLLILAGVAGAGAVLSAWPAAVTVVRVLGAAFLLGYAALSVRRALRPGALQVPGETTGGLGSAVATAATLTWLNPHVYLDTVLLLGSVSTGHGDQRWWFAVGACAGSVVWFTALGYGARTLRPLFARPAAWRVLDAGIAVVMTVIAVSLLRGL